MLLWLWLLVCALPWIAAKPRVSRTTIDFTSDDDGGDSAAFLPATVQGNDEDDGHYWWLRGGAWQFHEALHPCQLFNQTCVFESRAPDQQQQQQRAELQVNTTIVAHMGFVEVSYAVADGVHEGDFIGVYCVDEEEPTAPSVGDHDFIDYALLTASSSVETAVPPAVDGRDGDVRPHLVLSDDLQSHVVFGPLVNMRCSFQFRYIRQLAPLRFVSLGESPFVEMERGHSEPLQVQLALTGRADEMRVMWTSGKGKHHHVHYGRSQDALDRHAAANTTTYAVTELCHDPATTVSAQWFRHPGYRHDAVMTGLVPGETYFYRVGSRYGVRGRVFSFRQPPARSSHQPQSVFVFGDLGEGVLEPLAADERKQRRFEMTQFRSRPRSRSPQTVMRRIQQDVDEDVAAQYLAVIHIGDLAYAKGRTYLWDQFGAVIEPVASRLAYMVGVGNHEYDYTLGGHGRDPSGSRIGDANGWHPRGSNYGNDSKGECGVPTARRFRMPANGNGVFWYSFSLGLSHHIVLSSEHDCSAGAPMRAWLEHELAHGVDRQRTPWLFVHVHRPLYCSEKYAGDREVSLLLRTCLEELLLAHRVDAVFSGHYHAYERTCPVAQQVCRVDHATGHSHAPVHIMIGSGGAELDDIDYVLDANTTAWSVNRQQDYGYGRLHVHNETHVHFQFVRTRDRVVTDDVWIISTHDWEPFK